VTGEHGQLAIRRALIDSEQGEVAIVGILSGGANNQVYRIRLGERDLVAKVYFRHANDRRDRLATEWAFTSYAWNLGLRILPRPVAKFIEENVALYEYIAGRQLRHDEIDEGRVDEAVGFYVALNSMTGGPEARNLPTASEACFSIEEHLACVDGRIARLEHIDAVETVDSAARVFARSELRPAWDRVRGDIFDAALKERIDPGRVLDSEQRCLSPSDFGFHNSILGEDGRLRFIDFEYAGWDDPARLVCDFFCQCKVPVPLRLMERFVRNCALPGSEAAAARVALLLPLYRLKWCCILLNEFLPGAADRRRFALGSASPQARGEQLAKAREMLRLANVALH